MAEEAKAKGNAAYAAGNFTEAIKHFTEAIDFAPTNHILYSNRSAAYASLNEFSDALADAQKTVVLKPDWSKGYSRLGAAHLGLHQRDESIDAYRKGLDIDPDNEALKHGLAEALYSQAAQPRVSSDFPFETALKGEQMWIRLASSPSTWGYLQQPDFVKKIHDIQENSRNVGVYMMDPRIRDALTVLWGVKVSAEISIKGEKSPVEAEQEPAPELVELSDEEKETKDSNVDKETKDAGKGITRDEFAEGYIKKGAAKILMHRYEEALEAYQEGSVHVPGHPELQDGIRRCLEKMNKVALGDLTPEDESKAKGNSSFASGNFSEAIEHFTEAINFAPTNHVLYSNRSAAYASLNKFSDALVDAQRTVKLKPDWSKGYLRLGAAHLGLHQHDESIAAYGKGLDIDPDNEALKYGLAEAQYDQAARPWVSPDNLFEDALSDQEMWTRLASDSSTREYLQNPDFVMMMQEIHGNPRNLHLYVKDPRVRDALIVFSRPIEAEPEPEPVELSEVETEIKERKAEAQKEKEAGNVAYKKKDFETAVHHYSKAMEIDDQDISFLTNRAAVFLEMRKYEECINDCDKAVERGRELRSDCKMVARALTRKGTALTKMATCSKDYDPAIETYNKALTEHHNPETLKKLNDARKAKKILEQQEYFNPQIADWELEKGNQLFKEENYSDAVEHYSESIKRNPSNLLAYSNRAASYTKLGALHEGLKDAEKCIELDPKFVKGYIRKGAVQFFMNEYMEALDTYHEGLKHGPEDLELLNDISRCCEQVNKAFHGAQTPEELKEKQAKAMQDPEIQSILSDPIMRQILNDSREHSAAADEHFRNPILKNKFYKLLLAGIVQFG
ncbi:unnamed protein product [Cuscuta campestris]|uniref:STI1 domain-containing protein n=1 Tax=Cuscuta campestris TaxID=132261 RepID=A0A484NKG3_9ASTE|nr:unnamed protein product [Cuscuta campestris]